MKETAAWLSSNAHNWLSFFDRSHRDERAMENAAQVVTLQEEVGELRKELLATPSRQEILGTLTDDEV